MERDLINLNKKLKEKVETKVFENTNNNNNESDGKLILIKKTEVDNDPQQEQQQQQEEEIGLLKFKYEKEIEELKQFYEQQLLSKV
jgi:hypothetical protein